MTRLQETITMAMLTLVLLLSAAFTLDDIMTANIAMYIHQNVFKATHQHISGYTIETGTLPIWFKLALEERRGWRGVFKLSFSPVVFSWRGRVLGRHFSTASSRLTWGLRGQRLEPSTPTIISDESDYVKLCPMTMDTAVASSQQDGSVDYSLSDEEPSQSDSNSPTAVHTQVSGTGDSAGMTVVQLPVEQTVQVQAVIQAPQASVIQSPQMQTVQITSIAGLEGGESAVTDTQKRREILSRRPSYRKILNELSSDSSSIPRIEEEKPEDEVPPSSVSSVQVPTSIYQTSCGQYIAITQGGAIQIASPGSEGLQGVQSLAMSNSGTQILQYAAQAGDSGQQLFSVQGGQVVIQAATGDMPAYQLRSPTSGLPQGLVMAASPGSLSMHSPPVHTEEVTRKREVRLMKNREAARECRRKKKEYVRCLENRVGVLENQNKTLIEELRALKDIYCHKNE